MPCSETRTTLRYLRGELSDRGAARCAEHLHTCTECRATMRFGAETMLAARDEEENPSIDASGVRESMRPVATSAAATPSRGAFGLRGLFVGRPATAGQSSRPRWILMLGTAAVIMWLVLRGGNETPAVQAASISPAKAALAEGQPFVDSPSGLLAGRPRAVSALLPAGAAEFRVLIIDAAGQVCWSAAHRAGQPGVLAGDEQGGQRVLAPFPTAEQLPLEAGQPYGISIVIPGARMSASTRFTLDQAAAPAASQSAPATAPR